MVAWVRLELDVGTFADADFERHLQRARSSGTRFTTMAELGATPEHRRALYELNRTCSADIPGRGPFYTYEEYVAQRIDVATFNPGGVIIAVHGADWIGMSATSLRPDRGYAFSEMTGEPFSRIGMSHETCRRAAVASCRMVYDRCQGPADVEADVSETVPAFVAALNTLLEPSDGRPSVRSAE